MRRFHQILLFGTVLVLILSIVACGARKGEPKATVEPIPTPEAFYNQPTTVITPQAATVTPETTAAADLALGQRVWDGKCASCHGAKGEGVPDKGKGVAGWSQTAQEFEDLLRTGGKGKLGNEHLYGLNQISPVGMAGLYAYVQTLIKP